MSFVPHLYSHAMHSKAFGSPLSVPALSDFDSYHNPTFSATDKGLLERDRRQDKKVDCRAAIATLIEKMGSISSQGLLPELRLMAISKFLS